MPLSKPVNRKLNHIRNITVNGYERDDGLWDIEGHIVDTKTYDFPSQFRDGYISAGEHVHEMWLRLSLDDSMEVREVEAVTDFGPFPVCPNVTPNFKRLIGEKIKPGWTRRVRELLGGIQGCTHLVELLGPIATIAYQTMLPPNKNRPEAKSRLVNSCYAWASNSPVVRQLYPEEYEPSES